MKKVLINIGNTHVELSSFDFEQQFKWRTADFINAAGDYLADCEQAFVSTVVPAFKEILHEAFPDCEFSFLNYQNLEDKVDFSLVEPSTIGADRLANALAIVELDIAPAMVVDCGTCITAEVISEDHKFLGGFIMPGRQLQRRALNSYTGQLPDVPLVSELPEFPGRGTVKSIQNGIDRAAVAAVQSFIDESRFLYGDGIDIFFNGGDAPYFLRELEEAESAPQNLTFIGIRAFAELLKRD